MRIKIITWEVKEILVEVVNSPMHDIIGKADRKFLLVHVFMIMRVSLDHLQSCVSNVWTMDSWLPNLSPTLVYWPRQHKMRDFIFFLLKSIWKYTLKKRRAYSCWYTFLVIKICLRLPFFFPTLTHKNSMSDPFEIYLHKWPTFRFIFCLVVINTAISGGGTIRNWHVTLPVKIFLS